VFKYIFLVFSILFICLSCNNNASKEKPQNTAIERIGTQEPSEAEKIENAVFSDKNFYIQDINYYWLNSYYIKELLELKNIETLEIGSDAPKDLSFLNNLEQLKKLIVYASYSEEMIESLINVYNLLNLEILKVECYNRLKNLDFLKNFTHVKSLIIFCSGRGDRVVNTNALRLMNNLEYLEIAGGGITITDNSLFSGMKKLKELEWRAYDIKNTLDEKELFNLPNLESLRLKGYIFFSKPDSYNLDINKIILSLPNLRKLWISDVKEYYDITNIVTLKNLEELTIFLNNDHKPRPDSIDLTYLGTLEKLKKLSVNCVNINSIVNLKNPNLEYLSLSNYWQRPEINFNLLSGLKNLKSLNLNSVKVNDVRPLLEFPNLEDVHFDLYVEYTDISPLAESNTIKKIEIWGDYYRSVIPVELFENRGIILNINYPGKE